MKDFISKKFKQRLNELRLSVHTIERLEDRVWGNKPAGPASINAQAWANPENFPEEDVIGVVNNKFHKEKAPVTPHVKRILDEIEFIKTIDFDRSIDMAIIFWKSNKMETGLGQKPPGNVLVGVLRHNDLITIQWQPSSSISNGRITDINTVIEFDKLQQYITSNNLKTITPADIKKLTIKEKPVDPKKEDELVININGVKYVLDGDKGVFYKKNDIGKYMRGEVPKNELYKLDDIFDRLPEDLQSKILSKIN